MPYPRRDPASRIYRQAIRFPVFIKFLVKEEVKIKNIMSHITSKAIIVESARNPQVSIVVKTKKVSKQETRTVVTF